MLGFERPTDFETFRTSIVTARALCACRLTNVCGNKQKKRAKCMRAQIQKQIYATVLIKLFYNRHLNFDR